MGLVGSGPGRARRCDTPGRLSTLAAGAMVGPPGILVVDLRIPEPDRAAGDRCLSDILGTLLRLGHAVTFLPSDRVLTEPWTAELERTGVRVLGPEIRLGRWLRTEGAGVGHVLLARPRIARRFLPLVRRHAAARVLYFTHDLHHLRVQRQAVIEADPAGAARAERLRAIEIAIFEQVDGVLATSEAEASTIRGLAPAARVTVLPPWIVRPTPRDPAGLAGREDILFVGSYDHPPNVDAAKHLVREVLPLVWARRPNVRAWIVGGPMPAELRVLAADRVEVTGRVPDMAPYYGRARLTLSPLRYGAGVKGKIVESLAVGVPVVTTSIGAEGLALTHGVDALVADSPRDLADSALRVLEDDTLAEGLAQAGRRLVARRFAPDEMARALETALALAAQQPTGWRPGIAAAPAAPDTDRGPGAA